MTTQDRIVYLLTGNKDNDVVLHFAIPDGCWKEMRNFYAMDFDFTKVGVSLICLITRCRTRAEGIEFLRKQGATISKSPEAKESWILLSVGETASGIPLCLIILPNAAKEALQNRNSQTVSMHSLGLPVHLTVSARPTQQDCKELLDRVVPSGKRLIDARALDLTIMENTATTIH